MVEVNLANLGAEESAVVFDANLTAAEKIGHRCDSLLCIFRAGADREDQVTERKLRSWLEDLGILFHNLADLDSSSGATFNMRWDHWAKPLGLPFAYDKKRCQADSRVQLMNTVAAIATRLH